MVLGKEEGVCAGRTGISKQRALGTWLGLVLLRGLIPWRLTLLVVCTGHVQVWGQLNTRVGEYLRLYHSGRPQDRDSSEDSRM